jgi:hypothetical protein
MKNKNQNQKKSTQPKQNDGGIQNRIDVTVDPIVIKEIMASIKQISAKLPFLLSLSDTEKTGMLGINVSNKQWTEDAINEMKDDPSILPAYMHNAIGYTEHDLQLYSDLDKIIIPLLDLVGKLSSTQFLAGAEAYNVALIYYNLLPVAIKVGVPGAQDKYNRLKARFMGQGTKTPTVPTQPQKPITPGA